MTPEQQAAFVFAQSACALIECAAMTAENQIRISRGESLAYDEAAFMGLQRQYGIDHNSVVGGFRT